MKFLHDYKNAPHYSNLENFYLNNLLDFDPNKPLILKYGSIEDIFNSTLFEDGV